MKGLIFNIKRYAIHDGPGIRVTFFMKGCPLGCRWCHNPEGISQEVEEVVRVDRIGEKEFRVKETVGRKYTVEDLFVVIEKERVFIDESGGGVTFSGGEPLMQHLFLFEALTRFKKDDIHTAVDTSGQTDRPVLEKIIPVTDLFLFDIKHMDPVRHKEYTGVSNEKILSNYKFILKMNKDVIVRIPVIPGYNDGIDHLNLLKKFLHEPDRENLLRIDLLPYHKIGSSKYRRFDLEYKMRGVEQPADEKMKEVKAIFTNDGFKVKIGG
ncbi:MAG: glycyl-radical enzyme activating protein [Bacteroidales bacterium]|nr:glycyl-radical enzyme activating protein [Bacteroidales bacterium]